MRTCKLILIFIEIKVVMTRKELLETRRTELINELFDIVDQLHSAVFETVEQLDGLANRQESLERAIANLDARIKRVSAEE